MNHIKEVRKSGLVLQLLMNLEKCRGVELLSEEGQVHIRTRLPMMLGRSLLALEVHQSVFAHSAPLTFLTQNLFLLQCSCGFPPFLLVP